MKMVTLLLTMGDSFNQLEHTSVQRNVHVPKMPLSSAAYFGTLGMKWLSHVLTMESSTTLTSRPKTFATRELSSVLALPALKAR
jgi:hypothetical protein